MNVYKCSGIHDPKTGVSEWLDEWAVTVLEHKYRNDLGIDAGIPSSEKRVSPHVISDSDSFLLSLFTGKGLGKMKGGSI